MDSKKYRYFISASLILMLPIIYWAANMGDKTNALNISNAPESSSPIDHADNIISIDSNPNSCEHKVALYLEDGSMNCITDLNSITPEQARNLNYIIMPNGEKLINSGKTIGGDAWQQLKISEWQHRRGYPNNGDQPTEYSSYNTESLKKMAVEGDVQAAHELANRLFSKEEYEQHLKLAAIDGSTHVFTMLAINERNKIEKAITMGRSKEEIKEMYIKILAYYEVADIRGDILPGYHGRKEILQHIIHNGIVLSEDDQNKIKTISYEMYNDLQQERYRNGLGDFDNSVDEEVEKYFKRLIGVPDE
jgi:hypothetical protein